MRFWRLRFIWIWRQRSLTKILHIGWVERNKVSQRHSHFWYPQEHVLCSAMLQLEALWGATSTIKKIRFLSRSSKILHDLMDSSVLHNNCQIGMQWASIMEWMWANLVFGFVERKRVLEWEHSRMMDLSTEGEMLVLLQVIHSMPSSPDNVAWQIGLVEAGALPPVCWSPLREHQWWLPRPWPCVLG